MSLNIKTGASWERKDEEEDEVEVGRSKIFLNRKANRDFRVNELFRKNALRIGDDVEPTDKDGENEVDEEKIEAPKPKGKESLETLKIEDKTAEIRKEEEEQKKKKKVLYLFL